MQPKLPMFNVMYECGNPDCFYVGSLLTLEDVSWRDVWNSNLQDLDLIPICPSCADPMMIWDGENE